MKCRSLDLVPWIVGSVFCLAVALSGKAVAQESDDSEREELENIIVTGSRIPRPDLVSNSPLVSLDAERFQIDADTNVVRQLQALPAFTPTRSPSSGEGGAFTGSFLDLRGIGRHRLLVLVNGRRWISAISDGGVDVSTIPPELIERVDVVTGGASATYGSDAVAGVVNFVLKEDFEGVTLSLQSGISEKGEDIGSRMSITGGARFAEENGSSYFHISRDNTESVVANGRDYLDPVVQNLGGVLVPVNSSSTNTATAAVNSETARFVNGELFSAPGLGNPLGASDLYNPGFLARLQFPQDKAQIAAGVRYQITDSLDFFADGTYIKEEILVEIAPRALSLSGFDIPVDHPFVGPLTQAYLESLDTDADGFAQIPGLSRRLTEMGQQRFNERDSFHVGAGLEFDLPSTWQVETFATYSESINNVRLFGFPHLGRLAQALDVVNGSNGPECRVKDFARTRCIPLNIFGEDTITEAAGDFINAEAVITTINKDFDAQAIVSGTLLDLPAGEVGFAGGVEWRHAEGGERPNEIMRFGQTDLVFADFLATLEQSEFFAEVALPLLEDAPLANYLGLELGVRYTDFEPGADAWTYKALAEWSPTEQVKFRGGFQRATRAPNFFELGAGDQEFDPLAILEGIDPCFTGAPLTGDVRTSCIANGVPASVADAGAALPGAQEFFFSFFGNPNLKPEVADTYTVGVVLSDFAVEDLSVTVDYFDISLEDAIDGVSEDFIFEKCFLSGTSGIDPFCNEITRDPSTGLVTSLNAGFANLGEVETAGVDVGVNYRFPMSIGPFSSDSSLTVDVIASYLLKWEQQTLAEDPNTRFACDGLFGGFNCGRPRPDWESLTRFTWENGPLSAALTWSWIGSVTADATVFDPDFVDELAIVEIPDHHYLDLTAVWRANETFEIRAGVENLTAKKPPVLGIDQGTPSSDMNTFPGQYDAFGRRYFVGLRINFQ